MENAPVLRGTFRLLLMCGKTGVSEMSTNVVTVPERPAVEYLEETVEISRQTTYYPSQWAPGSGCLGLWNCGVRSPDRKGIPGRVVNSLLRGYRSRSVN